MKDSKPDLILVQIPTMRIWPALSPLARITRARCILISPKHGWCAEFLVYADVQHLGEALRGAVLPDPISGRDS